MRAFNAMVVHTLIYGCERWTLQRRYEGKIQACEMILPRRVEGVTRLDRVRNKDVRRSHGQELVMNTVKKQEDER